MRVLAGLIRPDSGELLVHGSPVRFRSVADATAAGIGMVHQHFMLVPSMTVAENVCLGLPTARRVFPEVRRVARELAELSRRHGLELDPEARVAHLSVGQQQRVEILKAVYRGARILILDEPTAVLTPQEADSLLAVLRSLTAMKPAESAQSAFSAMKPAESAQPTYSAQETSIVFISHKLREVMAIADRVTVMRRGRGVGTHRTADTSGSELASLMVGREVEEAAPRDQTPPDSDPVLTIRQARVADRRGVLRLDGITLDLRPGEILGVAGVDGNGQRELAEAISGTQRLTSGSITLEPQSATVAHVPEDRQRTGLVMDMSITDNAMLEVAEKRPNSRRGWINPKAMRSATEQLIERYDIRCSGPDQKVRELSGGNQQKLLLAREIAREPAVLVVSQPTRGLDIGAIEYVHGQLRALRDRGCAILLISTELDEILALSDRVAVLFGGRVMAVTDRAGVRISEIGLQMAGRR
jgi:simple sugar transport system ATP-binding protein